MNLHLSFGTIVTCMKRTLSVQEIKKKVVPILKPYGVKRAGLFGSAARGDLTVGSDVDLLVDITKPIGLFEFVRLERELEEALGRKVDLVERKSLKPRLKPYVMKDYRSIL